MISQWQIQDSPDGEGTNPTGKAPTYYLTNFLRKLHESKKNWAKEQGRFLTPDSLPRFFYAIDIYKRTNSILFTMSSFIHMYAYISSFSDVNECQSDALNECNTEISICINTPGSYM